MDGKSSFLTKDYSPLAIYYNKDLFDKAGVPYPKDGWTWEDFQDTAVKLTYGAVAPRSVWRCPAGQLDPRGRAVHLPERRRRFQPGWHQDQRIPGQRRHGGSYPVLC